MAVRLPSRSSRATRSFNAIGVAHVLRFINDRSDTYASIGIYAPADIATAPSDARFWG
jgi:hypothetical protein